ncbi:NADPH:quinone oxidoreductase family protein [Nocardioides immobilis]|uniref:NADPH:quinone oxidoreductase family protein n=2 Tax=Nocardioides immobilis TaxID=2049295 RepID=A0A417Y6V6_9ACTN|nr:NADPH:quinone oxidoreductase family protein [Nocardioides immobilis]
MRAWMFERTGNPREVLALRDLPVPQPSPGQVLVRVRAASVNFSDALIVRGTYQLRPPLPAVAGMEVAGETLGDDPATGLSAGTRVAGLTTGLVGAFAEYAVLDRASVFAPPPSYSYPEAACFPVAFQTAWFAVHVRGRVRAGDVVLVHAAAGGVGLAAVQLAHAAGARVIGIVGDEAKREVAKAAGCAEVLLRGGDDLVGRVKETAGGSVHVVVDPVGGAAHAVSERVVGFDGRIVIVGFASGQVPAVRADLAMVKNYSVVGLHWGLYRDKAPDVVVEEYQRLVAVVGEAGIRPVVSSVVSFACVPEAVAAVESGQTAGRVAVDLGLPTPA